MAQSEFEFKPLRSMHFRCQPALVIAIGFASALMLGSLLWNLTSPSPHQPLESCVQAKKVPT